MIADSIDNIEIYKNISRDIYEGLQFLKKVSPDIEPGTYQVNENVKAIVSEFETKEIFERGYEAHRYAIDIHYPVTGREKISWSPLKGMTNHIEYNPVKDAAFYKDPMQVSSVIVGNGIFAIYFPGDAHSPQLFVDKPEKIKKIVLKVAV
jgi:YhcH/YjgK/YiaL family protein